MAPGLSGHLFHYAEIRFAALVSSLFDSWFGYILWACCFFQLYRRKPVHERTFIDKVEVGVNVVMLIVGLFFFGAGTYAAVQSIMTSYATGAISEWLWMYCYLAKFETLI